MTAAAAFDRITAGIVGLWPTLDWGRQRSVGREADDTARSGRGRQGGKHEVEA
jgi:hypothetical protein